MVGIPCNEFVCSFVKAVKVAQIDETSFGTNIALGGATRRIYPKHLLPASPLVIAPRLALRDSMGDVSRPNLLNLRQ